MSNALLTVPPPRNEPVLDYRPGSPERKALADQLEKMLGAEYEIPVIIGGKEIRTGEMGDCRCPHDHGHLLARYHKARPSDVERAEKAAAAAWNEWSEMDWRALEDHPVLAGQEIGHLENDRLSVSLHGKVMGHVISLYPVGEESRAHVFLKGVM